MDKKTKQQIATVGTGILIGTGITYAIMKDSPCEGCTCEKKLSSMEAIKKQKEEYLSHRESNQCFTNPCDTCPHKEN
jgi:hypothetical protein